VIEPAHRSVLGVHTGRRRGNTFSRRTPCGRPNRRFCGQKARKGTGDGRASSPSGISLPTLVLHGFLPVVFFCGSLGAHHVSWTGLSVGKGGPETCRHLADSGRENRTVCTAACSVAKEGRGLGCRHMLLTNSDNGCATAIELKLSCRSVQVLHSTREPRPERNSSTSPLVFDLLLLPLGFSLLDGCTQLVVTTLRPAQQWLARN